MNEKYDVETYGNRHECRDVKISHLAEHTETRDEYDCTIRRTILPQRGECEDNRNEKRQLPEVLHDSLLNIAFDAAIQQRTKANAQSIFPGQGFGSPALNPYRQNPGESATLFSPPDSDGDGSTSATKEMRHPEYSDRI